MSSIHNTIDKPAGNSTTHFQNYTCAHCDSKVSGAIIAQTGLTGDGRSGVKWLYCPNCSKGTVWVDSIYYPSVKFSFNIQGLPEDTKQAYDEARRCMSVSAYTASKLLCRKILMHVAVEKGAKEGDNFTNYLNHLETSGYITPPIKAWADLIRQNGNEATHKLSEPTKERAESTILFTAELLRLVYEMDFLAKKYLPSSTS